MAQLSPTQAAWRGRIEAGIRIAEPFLDLLLAAGDRISRVVERDEIDQPPATRVLEERRAQLSGGSEATD